jgi:hypothetical protein
MQDQRWAREVERNIRELGEHVNRLSRRQAEHDHDRQLQAAHDLVAKIYSQSISYTNLIMVVGYAGLLTLWSKLKPDLPPALFSLTGLLIGLSLVLFISWELVKMVGGHLKIRRLQKSLEGAKPGPGTIARFQNELQGYEAGWAKLWPWFFIPTLISGIGASLLLLGFFGWKLIEYGF